MEEKKRRHFPDEFKRQAVERVERQFSNSGMGVKLSLGTCRFHCFLRGRGFALRMVALEDVGGSMCE